MQEQSITTTQPDQRRSGPARATRRTNELLLEELAGVTMNPSKRTAVVLRERAEFDGDTLLTKLQVCAIFNIPERTLDSWVLRGRMPSPLRIGNRYYWKASDIKAMIKTHYDQATDIMVDPHAAVWAALDKANRRNDRAKVNLASVRAARQELEVEREAFRIEQAKAAKPAL